MTGIPKGRLAQLRQKAGLSQADLARLSGLSCAAISLLEKGEREPILSSAIKISEALNISIYFLVGAIEYPLSESDARAELTKTVLAMLKINNTTQSILKYHPNIK